MLSVALGGVYAFVSLLILGIASGTEAMYRVLQVAGRSS
jgi:hypothetical protein